MNGELTHRTPAGIWGATPNEATLASTGSEAAFLGPGGGDVCAEKQRQGCTPQLGCGLPLGTVDAPEVGGEVLVDGVGGHALHGPPPTGDGRLWHIVGEESER